MNQDYTTSFTVDQTPEEACAAINNVGGWWSQAIEGDTDKLGATFTYHYQDRRFPATGCRFRVAPRVGTVKVPNDGIQRARLAKRGVR